MSKGDRTKAQLVDAAIVLFYEHGVQWVSFQQVATRVGITQAALYKHFQDKDDLLHACAVVCAESGRDIIDQFISTAKSPAEKIRSYIRGCFEWQRQHPKEAVVILSLTYFGFNSRPLQALLLRINDQRTTRLADFIREGRRDGAFVATRVEKKARVLQSLLFGELIKALHQPKEMTTDQRAQLVWAGFVKNLEA